MDPKKRSASHKRRTTRYVFFSLRSASLFDATNERGVYTSFFSFFRRLTDTYASLTNPSANKKCPSLSGSDKARTHPSCRTSLHPLAGPARRASRTARYRASATTRTSLRRLGGSAPVAKSLSGWRRGAPTGPPPPPRLPPLPRKAKRERRERRIRRRRRRGRGLPRGSPLPLRAA